MVGFATTSFDSFRHGNGFQSTMPLTIDSDDWSAPPASTEGGPFDVMFRITCFRISAISTKEQTCVSKIGFVAYWHDRRLIGWKPALLPAKLWGPELHLMNHTLESKVEYEQFELLDAQRGKVKRIINYAAVIEVPMELADFPWDCQRLTASFVSISHWRQLGLERWGSSPGEQIYRLKPVEQQADGSFFRLLWDGKIAEWVLRSYSIDTDTKALDAGFTRTAIDVHFNVSRQAAPYFWRGFFPQYILTAVTFIIFACPESTTLSDRLSLCFSMLFAVVAQMYVTADALPKIAFLTAIDKVMALSLCTVAWLAVGMVVETFVLDYYGLSAALIFRYWFCGLSLSTYGLICASATLPAKRRQEKRIVELEDSLRRSALTDSKVSRTLLRCAENVEAAGSYKLLMSRQTNRPISQSTAMLD